MKTAILLLNCFICQCKCTLSQNEDFMKIVFVECVSRLLSGKRQGTGAVLTHKQEQLSNCKGGEGGGGGEGVSKKVFYRISDVISWFLSSSNF